MLDFASHEAPSDVVLIHGAGGNNLLWRRTSNLLSGDGTAYAVNLPGHPSGEITCSTMADYARAADDFICEKDLRRPVVCGHSMGSAISLTLALDHPDDIGGLILVGAGAKLGVLPSIVEGLRSKPLRAIEESITPMSFHAIDLGLGREARAALSLSNLQVFLNDYLACDGFDVRARLGEIRCKTLIVCGDDDRMTPPKWSRFLSERIPDSKATYIPECGHMVPLERPQELGREIQSFLSELSPRTPLPR